MDHLPFDLRDTTPPDQAVGPPTPAQSIASDVPRLATRPKRMSRSEAEPMAPMRPQR